MLLALFYWWCDNQVFFLRVLMDIFEPWPSIELLTPCLYTVTEKLDGSNLCLSITDGDFRIFTRQEKNAFDAIPIVKKHQELFTPVRHAFERELQKSPLDSVLPNFGKKAFGVNIYGEFLNFLNMKRIKYCPPKEALFKIFGASVVFSEGEGKSSYRLLFPELEKLLESLGLKDSYLVPVQERHVSISEIFSRRDFCINSAYGNARVEGWVFHPESSGARTYKLKTPEFFERLASPKKRETNGKNSELADLYVSFFTESRAFSVKSKFGSITAANLGEAVAAFLQDVREEASKTNPELIYFFTVRKLSRLIRKLLRG
ncbi:RNA ligase family protein [Turicimonas muris]|uniref:RNA ligase family protein n=1 Tax=Turicimonas muris TaxID=1796652 RepID=UPI0026762EE0|nr:RNA ligase family protein [Turicimonas muris]